MSSVARPSARVLRAFADLFRQGSLRREALSRSARTRADVQASQRGAREAGRRDRAAPYETDAELSAGAGLRARLRYTATSSTGPSRTGKLRLIFCLYVLEHVKDAEAAGETLSRVERRAGALSPKVGNLRPITSSRASYQIPGLVLLAHELASASFRAAPRPCPSLAVSRGPPYRTGALEKRACAAGRCVRRTSRSGTSTVYVMAEPSCGVRACCDERSIPGGCARSGVLCALLADARDVCERIGTRTPARRAIWLSISGGPTGRDARLIGGRLRRWPEAMPWGEEQALRRCRHTSSARGSAESLRCRRHLAAENESARARLAQSCAAASSSCHRQHLACAIAGSFGSKGRSGAASRRPRVCSLRSSMRLTSGAIASAAEPESLESDGNQAAARAGTGKPSLRRGRTRAAWRPRQDLLPSASRSAKPFGARSRSTAAAAAVLLRSSRSASAGSGVLVGHGSPKEDKRSGIATPGGAPLSPRRRSGGAADRHDVDLSGAAPWKRTIVSHWRSSRS